jgi:sortase A
MGQQRLRRGDRIMVIAMTAVLLMGAGAVTAVWQATPPKRVVVDNPVSAAAAAAPAPEVTTTTAAPATTRPPVVKGAQASRAVAPPSNPYRKTPIVQIGTIEIPKIGLVHPIFEGITLTVIDHGPGHWPGSPMPGEPGNAVFAGHRVTHTHPFLRINELNPGDQVIFHMANGDFTYEVVEHFIVKPSELWITDPLPGEMVTFFGCHPPHFATHRYVVRAKLVSSTAG